jgi:hypothetical protein
MALPSRRAFCLRIILEKPTGSKLRCQSRGINIESDKKNETVFTKEARFMPFHDINQCYSVTGRTFERY